MTSVSTDSAATEPPSGPPWTQMGPHAKLRVGDDGVAEVLLDRPPLNIYDLAMRDGLIQAFTAVRDHPGCRVLVLRAQGRHFSAGADLTEFGTAPGIMAARRIRWDRDPWIPLWDSPVPTIAALHGYALGAGLEMSLLCDLRVASRDTQVGLPETGLGMLPSAGGTQSLLRTVGPARALPLVLTGSRVDAQRASELGLVDVVADDADATAGALAAHIASLPPHAVRAVIRSLRDGGDQPLTTALASERHLARLAEARRR